MRSSWDSDSTGLARLSYLFTVAQITGWRVEDVERIDLLVQCHELVKSSRQSQLKSPFCFFLAVGPFI